MAKVECKELAGQPCAFEYIGEIKFDENGIAEINHAELVAKLAHVKGFRILPEEPAPKPAKKDAPKPAAIVKEVEVPKEEIVKAEEQKQPLEE